MDCCEHCGLLEGGHIRLRKMLRCPTGMTVWTPRPMTFRDHYRIEREKRRDRNNEASAAQIAEARAQMQAEKEDAMARGAGGRPKGARTKMADLNTRSMPKNELYPKARSAGRR